MIENALKEAKSRAAAREAFEQRMIRLQQQAEHERKKREDARDYLRDFAEQKEEAGKSRLEEK